LLRLAALRASIGRTTTSPIAEDVRRVGALRLVDGKRSARRLARLGFSAPITRMATGRDWHGSKRTSL
jgi:hypothetical protein